MHFGSMFAVGRRGAAGILVGFGALLALACGDTLPVLTVTAPVHGTFTTASSILVTGTATGVPSTDLEVTVNGTVAPLQTNGSFQLSVPVSQSQILNPLTVKVRKISTGYVALKRVMVIGGPAVADGFYSSNGLGMRINESGLASLLPVVQGLINSSFDIQQLVLSANPIVDNYCVGTVPIFGGCIGRVDVNATSVTYTQPLSLSINAQNGFTSLGVTVSSLRVNYNVSGFVSCSGRIQSNSTNVSGNYDQIPGNPASTIDVNQMGNVGIGFSGFSNTFTSGICDFPLIGDLIQLILGDVEPIVRDGLVTNLGDPDGGGPADAPIAAALQDTLSGLEIAGPIGGALGVTLNADFNQVSEDSVGLTYRIDSRITNPAPLPGAPDQAASFHTTGAFPSFGATTPVGNVPYGLGLAISPSTFNQLLKAEIEDGLLQTEITEFQEIPLVAGVLALFLPEFGSLAPNYPLTIRIQPTLAPFLTGNNGPGGEIGDLRVPHVVGTIVGQDSFGAEIEFLRVAFDARIGLGFQLANGEMTPTISAVDPSDITVAVLQSVNPASEAALQAFLPQVIALVLPDLGASLGSLPLPEFLGLQLQAADQVRKVGQYLCLYVNLQ